MTKKEITQIVINQIEQLNDTLPGTQREIINTNSILFGYGSSIDSLSLVSVIVDLETLFSEEYGYEISLTDDRAMTREISPFDSIASLVDYIFEIVSEKEKT